MRKRITLEVTVSGPEWMTPAMARREVRDLINFQGFSGSYDGRSYDQIGFHNFKAVKVANKPATKRKTNWESIDTIKVCADNEITMADLAIQVKNSDDRKWQTLSVPVKTDGYGDYLTVEIVVPCTK